MSQHLAKTFAGRAGLHHGLRALPLLGLISLGCRGGAVRGCDEQQLTQAKDALAQGEIDEHDAVDRLSQACPNMPPTLIDRLRAYTLGLPSADLHGVRLGEGWRFTRLRGRTCADLERWGHMSQELEPATREAAMFEVCELERYGLLETGEVFIFEDLPGFFLTEYLRGVRVDEDVARGFARELMTAAQHGERARRRCRINSSSAACLEVARAEGLTLPRSRCTSSLGEATPMVLTLEAVALGDGPVLSLEAGRFAARDLDGSIVTPLHTRLEAVRRASERAATAGADWPAHMLIRADRDTRYGTLMQALFTARRAGFHDFGLLVRDTESAHELGFSPPPRWTTYDVIGHPEQALGAEVVIGATIEDGLRVRSQGVTTTLPGADLAGLEALARAVREAAPRATGVSVRAVESVPLWRVIEVLDALRGTNCWSARPTADEAKPPKCLFYDPILDLDPPLTRRPGNWDTLRLGEPRASAKEELPKGVPTLAQHRAEVERARPAIRECLLASDAARLWMPGRIEFMFGLGAKGERSVRMVDHELATDTRLQGCLREALADESRELVTVYAVVLLPIDVPG